MNKQEFLKAFEAQAEQTPPMTSEDVDLIIAAHNKAGTGSEAHFEKLRNHIGCKRLYFGVTKFSGMEILKTFDNELDELFETFKDSKLEFKSDVPLPWFDIRK